VIGIRPPGRRKRQFLHSFLSPGYSDGDGLVAVLEAYIDESGREQQSQVFGVSGYAFYPGMAAKFVDAWEPLWGGRSFHMKDFIALQGVFKGMKREEQSRLIVEAVKVINSHIRFGVCISCYLDEVRELAPRWIRGFGHAYSICAHLVLCQMGEIARKGENISYIFEDGHPDCGEADDFISGARRSYAYRKLYHYRSHAFVLKSDAVPLQAADMLAWEWTKFKDETLDKGMRDLRKSLRALFEAHPKQYKVAHITGVPLRKYFAQWDEIGREEIREAERRFRIRQV
jgi:Protein of unknown function (DUF3800)